MATTVSPPVAATRGDRPRRLGRLHAFIPWSPRWCSSNHVASCAGVEMVIKALTWMVWIFERRLYPVIDEIVWNAAVVEGVLLGFGVVFVDSIDEAPPGRSIMLFVLWLGSRGGVCC